MKIPEKQYQLLALVSLRELSGRDVAKRYEQETGKSISYGTLYTTFRRMREAGWVTARDDADEDGRVRFFRITASGIRTLNEARNQLESQATFGLPGKETI